MCSYSSQWILTGMKTVALQRSICCETPVKCQQDGEDNVAVSDFTVLYDLFLPTCSNIITPWETKSEIVGIQNKFDSCNLVHDMMYYVALSFLCRFFVSTIAFFCKMFIFLRQQNWFTLRTEWHIYISVNEIRFGWLCNSPIILEHPAQ